MVRRESGVARLEAHDALGQQAGRNYQNERKSDLRDDKRSTEPLLFEPGGSARAILQCCGERNSSGRERGRESEQERRDDRDTEREEEDSRVKLRGQELLESACCGVRRDSIEAPPGDYNGRATERESGRSAEQR